MVSVTSMVSKESASCGWPLVAHMFQGDSSWGALRVGTLPQVEATADVVSCGGRRLAELPVVAALARVAPGSSTRSLASVL